MTLTLLLWFFGEWLLFALRVYLVVPAISFRREQTRQNDGSCGAEQKLADLRRQRNRAASRRTTAEIALQVIGAKVTAVVVTG